MILVFLVTHWLWTEELNSANAFDRSNLPQERRYDVHLADPHFDVLQWVQTNVDAKPQGLWPVVYIGLKWDLMGSSKKKKKERESERELQFKGLFSSSTMCNDGTTFCLVALQCLTPPYSPAHLSSALGFFWPKSIRTTDQNSLRRLMYFFNNLLLKASFHWGATPWPDSDESGMGAEAVG